jgi:hypothetical protein
MKNKRKLRGRNLKSRTAPNRTFPNRTAPNRNLQSRGRSGTGNLGGGSIYAHDGNPTLPFFGKQPSDARCPVGHGSYAKGGDMDPYGPPDPRIPKPIKGKIPPDPQFPRMGCEGVMGCDCSTQGGVQTRICLTNGLGWTNSYGAAMICTPCQTDEGNDIGTWLGDTWGTCAGDSYSGYELHVACDEACYEAYGAGAVGSPVSQGGGCWYPPNTACGSSSPDGWPTPQFGLGRVDFPYWGCVDDYGDPVPEHDQDDHCDWACCAGRGLCHNVAEEHCSNPDMYKNSSWTPGKYCNSLCNVDNVANGTAGLCDCNNNPNCDTSFGAVYIENASPPSQAQNRDCCESSTCSLEADCEGMGLISSPGSSGYWPECSPDTLGYGGWECWDPIEQMCPPGMSGQLYCCFCNPNGAPCSCASVEWIDDTEYSCNPNTDCEAQWCGRKGGKLPRGRGRKMNRGGRTIPIAAGRVKTRKISQVINRNRPTHLNKKAGYAIPQDMGPDHSGRKINPTCAGIQSKYDCKSPCQWDYDNTMCI